MKVNISRSKLDQLNEKVTFDKIQKKVVGAIICRDDQVLLLERRGDDFMGGLVELPSGTVEQDEGLIEALKREAEEETGLEVGAVSEFVNTFDYTSGSGRNTRQFNFLVEASGEISVDDSEHVGFEWVDPRSDRFKQLNVSEKTAASVQLTLK